jgi:hypothetical protein
MQAQGGWECIGWGDGGAWQGQPTVNNEQAPRSAPRYGTWGYLPYQNTSRENQFAAFFGCTARSAEAGGGMGAGFYVKGLPANGNCLNWVG